MPLTYRNTLVLSLLVTLVGCSNGQSSTTVVGTIAIVDLDEVAKELGEDVELGHSIVAKRKELASELTKMQRKLDKEYKDKKDEFGEKPTEEQTKELQTLRQKHVAIIENGKMEAEYKASQHNKRLVGRYRAKATPAARRVADRKGFSIVIVKNDFLVLTYDDVVDITDDVVAELMKEEKSDSNAQKSSKKSK